VRRSYLRPAAPILFFDALLAVAAVAQPVRRSAQWSTGTSGWSTRLHIGPQKILCSSERSPFQRVRHKTNNEGACNQYVMMAKELKDIGEEYRKASNDSFASVVRSVNETQRGFQGIASEMTEQSKICRTGPWTSSSDREESVRHVRFGTHGVGADDFLRLPNFSHPRRRTAPECWWPRKVGFWKLSPTHCRT